MSLDQCRQRRHDPITMKTATKKPAAARPVNAPKTITLRFAECEHGGDLGVYTAAVQLAGGNVVSAELDKSSFGMGTVIAFVADDKAFMAAFEQDVASEFVVSKRVQL